MPKTIEKHTRIPLKAWIEVEESNRNISCWCMCPLHGSVITFFPVMYISLSHSHCLPSWVDTMIVDILHLLHNVSFLPATTLKLLFKES